jgi:hypothetical protein
VIAVVVAAAGGATAESLIDGGDVKNGSLTGADIKNKSLSAVDFRGPIRGASGHQGAQGIGGPVGPTGRIGPAGPTGPQGPAGAQGGKGGQGDKGERGPSNGRASRGLNPVISDSAPPGTKIDQLDLAAGSWLVSATATIGNATDDARTVTCELRAQGASDPFASTKPMDNVVVAQATAIVQGAVTLIEQTPVLFSCFSDGDNVTTNGARPQIQAVQVGTLEIDPDV